jgi:hypothetical protein
MIDAPAASRIKVELLNGVRNEEELTRAVAEQFSLPGSSRYQ